MINEQAIRKKMTQAVDHFHKQLAKIRTGRPNPALLDDVKVETYGNATPITQLGNVAVEGRNLIISVWDKANVQLIERAILAANLGLNPSTAGETIRIILPPLTEETRKEYVKQAKTQAEQTKISIRNIRRDENQLLKTQLKESQISENDLNREAVIIQKITDDWIKKSDDIFSEKEKEIMTI